MNPKTIIGTTISFTAAILLAGLIEKFVPGLKG